MAFEPASVDLVVPSAIFYAALVLTRRVKLPMRLPKSARIKIGIILIRRRGDRAKHPHHLPWPRRDRQGTVDLA